MQLIEGLRSDANKCMEEEQSNYFKDTTSWKFVSNDICALDKFMLQSVLSIKEILESNFV